jgi:DNA-directed RNA polymerase beta subunit
MLKVPDYELQNVNVFNFRHFEWDEDKIISNVTQMIRCGEEYNLRLRSISIKNKEESDVSEIKRTKSKILDIDLVYDAVEGEPEEINLSYDIPWLVNNHFYISGNYKVCIYQLFDLPLIKRSDMIKIRTNIQSVMIEKKTSSRSKYNYIVSLFGKKFAFGKLIIAYYGVERTREVFSINQNNEYVGPQLSEDKNLLVQDIIDILNDQLIDKTRLFDKEFPRKLDAKIIEDLLLITKIDIFSKKYFQTDNIIEELIYAIDHTGCDDSDYNNKRIRFVEQVIYCHLARDFYNLINSVRKNRKLKFSVNSKNILSNVNVSNIVQFDNSLNPLSELALLSRTSLSGPGGFEKTNVPQSLREIHPSMLYLIDPSDTADREGCGTIQYLVPNAEFREDGKFYSRTKKAINSIAVSFVPFLEHDDATRLQMASSQQRHAIMLKKFDLALIQTGVEGMYSDQTSFVFKAKRDGKVIYLDNEVIAVQYDNKACEAFHIGYRKLYISTIDFYKVYYNIGESFSKGSVIAESNYMKNSQICLGKNCLTCIMPWYGYNYEDGIVISEKLVNEDTFTSVHYVDLTIELTPNKVLMNLQDNYNDYRPLPEIGQRLTKGDIYAKIKAIDTDGFEDVIFEPMGEEVAPENCIIADIKVYANKWNKSFPQYDKFIQEMIKRRKGRKNEIVEKLSSYLTKDELDKLIDVLEMNQTEKNNFKIKGDSIDGLRIEITAIYERKISVGDKIGNRHGNKGIVSRIVPHEMMPTLPDGRKADVIINPLGITSRMNVGQVYEAHLSMALVDLKRKVTEMNQSGIDSKVIYSYILGFIDLIDKTEDKNYKKQMEDLFSRLPIQKFMDSIDNFYVIQPPFESINRNDLEKVMEYTGTQWEYECFDPVSGQKIDRTINFGYMYFLKLNHIAEDKISYRGVGPYSAKTSQPLGGKSRKGGQRLGEMEIWAVIAHGAEKNLNEFISTKSDSIKLRNRYISERMCNSDLLLDSDDDEVPQSLRLLQTNLTSVGLNYQLYEGEALPEQEEAKPQDPTVTAIENLKKVLGSETKEVAEPIKINAPLLEIGHSFGDQKIIYDKSILHEDEIETEQEQPEETESDD